VIEIWLDASVAAIFASLTLLYGVTAVLIVAACYGPAHNAIERLDGIAPPFLGAIAVIFALMAGFLASDIAERNRQATRAVQMEIAELSNVFTLSFASTTDMRAIRAAWTGYINAVAGEEWKTMTRGDSTPAADRAFDALLRGIGDPAIGRDAGNAVHVALLGAAIRVSTARSDRLSIASDTTSAVKWLVVLILGVMAQIGIGAVHLTRRGAQIGALAIFSLTAVISLGLIALQEHPFAGNMQMGAEPYFELLKRPAPGGAG